MPGAEGCPARPGLTAHAPDGAEVNGAPGSASLADQPPPRLRRSAEASANAEAPLPRRRRAPSVSWRASLSASLLHVLKPAQRHLLKPMSQRMKQVFAGWALEAVLTAARRPFRTWN